jgi:hypothetical protein
MRVEVKTEGGLAYLPGLSKPLILDTDNLTRAEAQELEELVEAADFFNLPSNLNKPSPGAADYQRYTITIDDGDQSHTVEATDLSEAEEVYDLVRFVREKARAAR